MQNSKEQAIIEAARGVFLRYGYRRTIMDDIAAAARMSRPALYDAFKSKEAIFTAVVQQEFAATLDEIRQAVGQCQTAEEKLTAAFEVWVVRPFEMVRASPDARDLLESSDQIVHTATAASFAAFESILAGVFEPLAQEQGEAGLSASETAKILASSALGLKASAENARQLRHLLQGLFRLVLAGLRGSHEASSRRLE